MYKLSTYLLVFLIISCSDYDKEINYPESKKIYFAEKLPRTATGKIQRRNVAKFFAD